MGENKNAKKLQVVVVVVGGEESMSRVPMKNRYMAI